MIVGYKSMHHILATARSIAKAFVIATSGPSADSFSPPCMTVRQPNRTWLQMQKACTGCLGVSDGWPLRTAEQSMRGGGSLNILIWLAPPADFALTCHLYTYVEAECELGV
jgi:hypothetical protein